MPFQDFKRDHPEWQRDHLNTTINVYESLSKKTIPLVNAPRRGKKSNVLSAAADIIDFSQKELNAAFEHTVKEYKRKRSEESRKEQYYRIQEIQRKKREKIYEIESNWNNDVDYQARKLEESRECETRTMCGKNNDTISRIYSASLGRKGQRRRVKPSQLVSSLKNYDGKSVFSTGSAAEAKSVPGITFERISSCTGNFNSFESVLEKEALNSIVMREGLLSDLRKYLRPFNFQFHEENLNQVQDIILKLSNVTLKAVENILKWKNSFVKSRPFNYRNVHEQNCNYFLKMMQDVQFVVSRQNIAKWLAATFKFSKLNSTKINPLFFNPDIDDDQLKKESILYGRFEEALKVLHQEEIVYGSLSDQHFFCTWCGVVPETPKCGGQSLVTCTQSGCRNRFCSNCIGINCGGKSMYHKIRISKVWVCYICEFNERQKQIKMKRLRQAKARKLASVKKATEGQKNNNKLSKERKYLVTTESEDMSMSANILLSKDNFDTKKAKELLLTKIGHQCKMINGCASVTLASKEEVRKHENIIMETKLKSKVVIAKSKPSPALLQKSKGDRNQKSDNKLKPKQNPSIQEQKKNNHKIKQSKVTITQSHSRKRKAKRKREKIEGNDKQIVEAPSSIDTILAIEKEATSTDFNSQLEKERQGRSALGLLEKVELQRNHEEERKLAKEWIQAKCKTVSRKMQLAGKASHDVPFTSLDLHELVIVDADLANYQKVAKLKMLRSSYAGNSHRMTMRLFNQICLVRVKSQQPEPNLNCNAKGKKLKLKRKQNKDHQGCITVTVLVPKDNLLMGPLLITKAQLGKSCKYLENLLKKAHRKNAQIFLREKSERVTRDVQHNRRKKEARDYLFFFGRKCKAHIWEKAKAVEVLRQRCNFAKQHCQMQIQAKHFLRNEIVERYREHQEQREEIREEFRRMGKRLFLHLKEQEMARLSIQCRANYLKTHQMHQYRTMQELRNLVEQRRSKMDIC